MGRQGFRKVAKKLPAKAKSTVHKVSAFRDANAPGIDKKLAFAIWHELQKLGLKKSASSMQEELEELFGTTSGHVIMGELVLQNVDEGKDSTEKKINKTDPVGDVESKEHVASGSKAKKINADTPNDSDSSSSSDSESSDDEAAKKAKKIKADASSDSDSSSSSGSESSDDEGAKKVKEADSDSSADSSDSGSEIIKQQTASDSKEKKDESDSSSDSSDSSSSDSEDSKEEKQEMIEPATKRAKTAHVVSPEDSDTEVSDVEVSDVSSDEVSSSESEDGSSSEDDDSDSDSSSDEEHMAQKRKATAKKAKDAAAAAAAWTPKAMSRAAEIKTTPGSDGAQALSAGKPFQRVDDSFWGAEAQKNGGAFADNSYERVFGSQGFGTKSSERLLQTRGKRFQHEKTKRKRSFNGLARTGGKIGMETNSTKFVYDD